MKKNRILIDVPGKFSEEHDSDPERVPDSDIGIGRENPTESRVVLAPFSTLPNQLPDKSYLDSEYPDKTYLDKSYLDSAYPDRSYPDRSYPDSGFVNRPDYNESVPPSEPAYVMEPRLLNPQSYSPIIYALSQPTVSDHLTTMSVQSFRTMVPSDAALPGIGESVSRRKAHASCTLPYLFVNKDSITDIHFAIRQNKMKLYNYWITTDDCARVKTAIVNMFGPDDIYVTKSFFFKKSNSYAGQRVILITQIPQRPYKFINKLNRKMSTEKRTVKSVNGDYLISCDCLLVILSNYSIDYICSNYYKYHKNEAAQIETVMKSLKAKFTCLDGKEL